MVEEDLATCVIAGWTLYSRVDHPVPGGPQPIDPTGLIRVVAVASDSRIGSPAPVTITLGEYGIQIRPEREAGTVPDFVQAVARFTLESLQGALRGVPSD